MCPLRIILIFLSATLAGFFVLRNLQSQETNITDASADTNENSPKDSSKACGVIGTGFWTFVDMASGKYLWRNLVSSPSAVSGSKRAE